MKAITILQPFASLIVAGFKQFETRTWSTSHRGPLLIHAGKGTSNISFKEVPWINDMKDLPKGAIVGIVDVVECYNHTSLPFIDEQERIVGNYGPGFFAWKLANPRMLAKPIACSGNLNIWNAPFSLEHILAEALNEALPALRNPSTRNAA